MDQSALIDTIYEAAAVPERWLSVLDRMTAMAGGAGASFVTGGMGPMRWIATPVVEDLIHDYGRQPHPNPRIDDALIRRHPGFVVDHQMFSAEFIESHPFYLDFMRPRGLGWCIGSAVFPPSADPIIFAVEKRYDDGPVDPSLIPEFDELRPHLARAATLSAQLALQHARATTDALGRVGLPAAVLGPSHRVRATNSAFDELVPTVAMDRRTRLTLVDAAADELFADSLARTDAHARGGVASIPLRPAGGRPAMVVHVLPVRKAAHDVFTSAGTIVIITAVKPGPSPEPMLLEGLFDLTPAEARVARHLCEGATIDDIASRRGVSAHTVRVQLKSIFAKTATSRQADLVRLLAAPVLNTDFSGADLPGS